MSATRSEIVRYTIGGYGLLFSALLPVLSVSVVPMLVGLAGILISTGLLAETVITQGRRLERAEWEKWTLLIDEMQDSHQRYLAQQLKSERRP